MLAGLTLTICVIQKLADDLGHLRPLIASAGMDALDERAGSVLPEPIKI
jgi:hypothetical protein